jgi:hypothetical protein
VLCGGDGLSQVPDFVIAKLDELVPFFSGFIPAKNRWCLRKLSNAEVGGIARTRWRRGLSPDGEARGSWRSESRGCAARSASRSQTHSSATGSAAGESGGLISGGLGFYIEQT